MFYKEITNKETRNTAQAYISLLSQTNGTENLFVVIIYLNTGASRTLGNIKMEKFAGIVTIVNSYFLLQSALF